MLTIEQISDRMELNQLVIDYANAIDLRDFDRLDRIFTPDAYIDYRAMGGIDGPYPKVKAWLPEALKVFPAYMHMVGNCSFDISGETASGRVACFNPMVLPDMGTGSQTMFLGLWYLDKYRRTANGWRITERREEKSYDHNVPEPVRKLMVQKS
jgi:hypothetical protein